MQPIERILGMSTSTRPSPSRWRMATGLSLALALLTAGIAPAAGSDKNAKEQAPASDEVIDKQFEAAGTELKAAVASGEMTEAEARLRAIEKALGRKAKAGRLDTRAVLRAVKRVDLTSDQKERIRAIERDAAGAYHKIPRNDKRARAELAALVKAEIDRLLNPEQAEQFEAALERLDRGSRRGKQSRSRRD